MCTFSSFCGNICQKSILFYGFFQRQDKNDSLGKGTGPDRTVLHLTEDKHGLKDDIPLMVFCKIKLNDVRGAIFSIHPSKLGLACYLLKTGVNICDT